MAAAKIQALKKGPFLVTGDVELTDSDNNPVAIAKQPIALCRCGHSTKRPFCDGSHRAADFQG